MARAGRKRAINVKRTPSGRASRAGAEPANLEPILLRMKMFGLSEQDARDQKAATFIGRLNLMDKKTLISNAQYDAAVEFQEVYDRYKRAIAAPDASKQSGGVSAGMDSDEYARWCHSAKARYNAAIDAVRAEQGLFENRGANLYAAVDYLVCRNEQHWHMVGDVRIALNALAHHFGLLGKTKLKQEAA
jgi:hypothetical protein